MKNIDLTKWLKAGDLVYSILTDKVVKITKVDVDDADFPITIGSTAGKAVPRKLNRFGSVLKDGIDCLIFPSKEVMTWDNYSPFKKGDVVACYNENENLKYIAIYSHKLVDGHYVFNEIDDQTIGYRVFQNCEYFNINHK